ALAHLLTQLDRLGSPISAQEPEFIVARAAGVDILEVVWTNQNVVSRHEMHHPQKGGSRYVARQALNDAGLQIHYHGVAETLRHERNTLVVRRNVRTLAEVRQDLNILRQMFERAA